MAEHVIAGIAEGCKQAGCALARRRDRGAARLLRQGRVRPGRLRGGRASSATQIIDGTKVSAGDQLIGVASSGLHSNGFSLARKVLLEHAGLELDAHVPELGKLLGDALLTPTTIYAKQCSRSPRPCR